MHRIFLPISKSIANRWLMLQAIHGDGQLTVSDAMPDDVLILHNALQQLLNHAEQATAVAVEQPTTLTRKKEPFVLLLGNCGTAMRFLTAFCAQREGQIVILDGVERMHHRPIGQLVDALRSMGADIQYIGKQGFPPLRIHGKVLNKNQTLTLNNPQSTQFVSALLLIGADVQTNCTSPYISLTRAMTEQYISSSIPSIQRGDGVRFIEKDWSSAAFWYEYVALYGGEIQLDGLYRDSLQGDKIVADIFTQLGVHTTFTAEGITLSPHRLIASSRTGIADLQGNNAQSTAQRFSEEILCQDFSACPDLYPAVALTCERLGIDLRATGTESLPWKESDRLRAVREHRTDHDHRMAMALLIAGYEVDDTDCIRKSYPQFMNELCKLRQ